MPVEGNEETKFYCKHCGLQLATGYIRVVIGDRGPYIEFEPKHMLLGNAHFPAQFHKYFNEYNSNCEHKVFIYHQRKTVSYADYVVGMFYISPELLSTDKYSFAAVIGSMPLSGS